MLGIALESGGAKGSYHAGVLKAVDELGMDISAISGSSIGAINAAMVAQGDIDKLCDFWLNISFDDLFDPADKSIVGVINGEINSTTLKNLKSTLQNTLKSKGISTDRIYNLLCELIDTEKLYASTTNYGLVTVSFPDMRPHVLFKHDIPKNDICKYILASATFPGFKLTEINGKKYIDGGAYDSCPINMLLENGCDEIIAVRIYGGGIFRAPSPSNAKIHYIEPSDSLGAILGFTKKQAETNIQMGYYDAMRYFKKLAGIKYCINGFDADVGFSCMSQISEDGIKRLATCMGIRSEKSCKRRLFEEVIPRLCEHLDLPQCCSYNDILIAALENRACRLGLDRFRYYTLPDFLHFVCSDISNVSMCKPRVKRSLSSIVDVFLSVLYHGM